MDHDTAVREASHAAAPGHPAGRPGSRACSAPCRQGAPMTPGHLRAAAARATGDTGGGRRDPGRGGPRRRRDPPAPRPARRAALGWRDRGRVRVVGIPQRHLGPDGASLARGPRCPRGSPCSGPAQHHRRGRRPPLAGGTWYRRPERRDHGARTARHQRLRPWLRRRCHRAGRPGPPLRRERRPHHRLRALAVVLRRRGQLAGPGLALARLARGPACRRPRAAPPGLRQTALRPALRQPSGPASAGCRAAVGDG